MRKVRYLRFAVALAAVLAVFASMQHHGVAVGSICMLCPVGFLSLTAASGSVAWALVPGVVAGLAIVLLVGRAFCSWLCPTGALKKVLVEGEKRPVLESLEFRLADCVQCRLCEDACIHKALRVGSDVACERILEFEPRVFRGEKKKAKGLLFGGRR